MFDNNIHLKISFLNKELFFIPITKDIGLNTNPFMNIIYSRLRLIKNSLKLTATSDKSLCKY